MKIVHVSLYHLAKQTHKKHLNSVLQLLNLVCIEGDWQQHFQAALWPEYEAIGLPSLVAVVTSNKRVQSLLEKQIRKHLAFGVNQQSCMWVSGITLINCSSHSDAEYLKAVFQAVSDNILVQKSFVIKMWKWNCVGIFEELNFPI